MLGYAVETRPARRKASPTTLALIIAGHAALILAVMNSKMDMPTRPLGPPLVIKTIELPEDPPPVPPEPQTPQTDPQTRPQIPLDPPIQVVPTPLRDPPIEFRPPQPIPESTGPLQIPEPLKPIVRAGPKFVTSEGMRRPPYPEAKRRLEEEAILRLRLAIDERGRVRSVDPIGTADPMFLASARNHLLRHWRYTPATDGGHAVPSSIVVTLRFKLDAI